MRSTNLYADSPETSTAFCSKMLDREPVELPLTFFMLMLDGGFKLHLWSLHTVEPAVAGGSVEMIFFLEAPDAVDVIHAQWNGRWLKILQTPTDMDFRRISVLHLNSTIIACSSTVWTKQWEHCHERRLLARVASVDHVRRRRTGGFMQVYHGQASPLRRIKARDGAVYYSPSTVMGSKDGLKSFTSIGRVRRGEAYQFDMGVGFPPSRRDVDWAASHDMLITTLFRQLDFTAGSSCGYQLRLGLCPFSEHDFRLIIAGAMSAEFRLEISA